jgi:hypothetical protein
LPTVGQLIDEAGESLNAGDAQVDDQVFRKRLFRMFLRAAAKAWTFRPMSRRYASDTVTVQAGLGVVSMPSTFGSAGPKFHVYVTGKRREVIYRDPTAVADLLERNDVAALYPDFYTIVGAAGDTGFPRLKLFRTNSGDLSLTLENYIRKIPVLVDRPGACLATVTADAGNPHSTSYTYQVTFVTADGETEGGPASAAVSAVDFQVALTEIPVSIVPEVTARKIYRNADGGEQPMLVATINDNVTTTFTDNVADADLGGNVPTPANAVTGLEQFPADHHRLALLESLLQIASRGEGDARSGGEFTLETLRAFSQMWAEESPQNVPKRPPRYGVRALSRW